MQVKKSSTLLNVQITLEMTFLKTLINSERPSRLIYEISLSLNISSGLYSQHYHTFIYKYPSYHLYIANTPDLFQERRAMSWLVNPMPLKTRGSVCFDTCLPVKTSILSQSQRKAVELRDTEKEEVNERANETIRSAAPDTICTAIDADMVATVPTRPSHTLYDVHREGSCQTLPIVLFAGLDMTFARSRLILSGNICIFCVYWVHFALSKMGWDQSMGIDYN